MSDQETIEGEVVHTSLVRPNEREESDAMTDLQDLGLILPLATPTRIREALAQKQRLFAAILDENDYIYSVAYTENNRQKQNIYARRADAEKAAGAYKVEIRASPKKSGIVKLAAALGVEARRTVTSGLPLDPSATYSYVTYEATHKRSGRVEEGIGWCDRAERGDRVRIHDIIATADTRAYNRAVLRLAGFGEVSAEEILSSSHVPGEMFSQPNVEESTPKKPDALPESTGVDILTAQRCWAEESSKRNEAPVPDAQQNSHDARFLRAKARRGDESAARQMGARGLSWRGVAQDSIGHETFQVEAPTVTAQDFKRLAEANGSPESAGDKTGWNLSGTGNAHEENRKPDEKPVSREQAAASIPAAGVARKVGVTSGDSETITNTQAKALSEILMAKLGTRAAAQAWLKKHADVERSPLVRQHQYEDVMNLLKKEI